MHRFVPKHAKARSSRKLWMEAERVLEFVVAVGMALLLTYFLVLATGR
ncbi:MAG: hypothetical protein ACRD4M_03930 [Candidatus Acidiferrales bacterium]